MGSMWGDVEGRPISVLTHHTRGWIAKSRIRHTLFLPALPHLPVLAHHPRGRLRYEDPKTAKWRVFDSIELDGNNDDDEPAETAVVPEQLALFAASAAPPDLRAAIARRIDIGTAVFEEQLHELPGYIHVTLTERTRITIADDRE